MKIPHSARLAALVLAAVSLVANAQDKKAAPLPPAASEPAAKAEGEKHITAPEAAYQGAASPLASEPMHPNANPKAPKMTEAEFEIGRKTYFERHGRIWATCILMALRPRAVNSWARRIMPSRPRPRKQPEP